ncbi:hypothetical protein V6W80_14885 [Pseudomonas benzopyrenica]|uniref:Uncharacterized protein n=1 Tax=Pseudomonas benzopyrenica TaxID=2993566 RepID=A0ABZ2FMM4_9PSED
MSPDSSEVTEGFLLLGYADARLLKLYRTGEVDTLELVRDMASLTLNAEGSGEAVPVYEQTLAYDSLPQACMNKTICLAGANEEGAMDTLIRHLEEGRAEGLELHPFDEHEQRLDLPEEEFADYSEEDLIEATRLAMAELAADEEASGASYQGLPPRSKR